MIFSQLTITFIFISIFILILIIILIYIFVIKPIPVSPPDNLPTDRQRIETLELCGDLHSQCRDVISYVKRGIRTFISSPIDKWQKEALDNAEEETGLYWFVYRIDGFQLVQGTPDYTPTNLSGLADETGKNITTDIINTAQEGGGWITYYWNVDIQRDTFNDTLVKKKYSYVAPFTTNDGSLYIAGAGIYLYPELNAMDQTCQIESTIEHCSLDMLSQCQRVMIRVNTVKGLFREYGTIRALEILEKHRESFTNKEIYIYANDFNGNVLYNSLVPSDEGTNVSDSPCFQDALSHIIRCGGGWNICTLFDKKAQGFDIEATNCPTCPYSERIIIGSSFNP
jgi:hypothetical protein